MSVRFKKMKLWQSLAKIKSLHFPSLEDPSAIYKLSPKCVNGQKTNRMESENSYDGK